MKQLFFSLLIIALPTFTVLTISSTYAFDEIVDENKVVPYTALGVLTGGVTIGLHKTQIKKLELETEKALLAIDAKIDKYDTSKIERATRELEEYELKTRSKFRSASSVMHDYDNQIIRINDRISLTKSRVRMAREMYPEMSVYKKYISESVGNLSALREKLGSITSLRNRLQSEITRHHGIIDGFYRQIEEAEYVRLIEGRNAITEKYLLGRSKIIKIARLGMVTAAGLALLAGYTAYSMNGNQWTENRDSPSKKVPDHKLAKVPATKASAASK